LFPCLSALYLLCSPCLAYDPRRRLSHSMSHSAHDDDSYFADRVPLTRGYPSPPTSLRGSRDSDDSLRALELSDGPLEPPRRPRAHSISGFNFQSDLIPLSASVSDSDPTVGVEQGEKNIGLVKGTPISVNDSTPMQTDSSGIALIVGSQVCALRPRPLSDA